MYNLGIFLTFLYYYIFIIFYYFIRTFLLYNCLHNHNKDHESSRHIYIYIYIDTPYRPHYISYIVVPSDAINIYHL